MRLNLLFLLILLSGNKFVFSQNFLMENISGGTAFANDVNGMPFYLKMEYKSEGSIFFTEEYISADVTTLQGVVYKNVKVKYNLLDKQLLYLDTTGQEMIALSPITKIAFYMKQLTGDSLQNVVLTGGTDIINKTGAAIYQLIDTGKATLLRKITLTWRDDTQYGQAGFVRKFERNENDYWIVVNGVYSKIVRGHSYFSELFKDRTADISQYINKQKPKYKTLTDIRKIVQFYNSL